MNGKRFHPEQSILPEKKPGVSQSIVQLVILAGNNIA